MPLLKKNVHSDKNAAAYQHDHRFLEVSLCLSQWQFSPCLELAPQRPLHYKQINNHEKKHYFLKDLQRFESVISTYLTSF